jgi:signal transduction histidine kinase
MYERPQVEALELEPFLQSFAGLVAPEAERRGLAVHLHVPAPCRAACDPRALQQVLLNLFANAVDASRDGSAPEIRVSASAADGLVAIRFADNGVGMDEEQLKHLFKPFHTSKEQGTGLGLVIARKMLSKMGGTIAVESTKGVGTVVGITLPEWAADA